MTTSDKLREFAERLFPYGCAVSAGIIDVQRNRCMQLLTALISEHYVAKEEVDKMVEERLRKELIAYDKWLYYKWIEGDVTTTEEHINEYLKSREK